MKYIQYGGALFNAHCKCGRFVKSHKDLSVNSFMLSIIRNVNPTAPAKCKKCGNVWVEFIKFEDAA